MANSQTIKQRFLDILFENEDDEEENINKVSNVKETPRVKASDILYTKKEEKDIKEDKPKKSESAFINYDDKFIKEEKKTEKIEEVYVAQPALSPIFGDLDKNNVKKKKTEPISVDYASTEKPSSNYLGIVLSPIYGYDSVSANDARSKLNNKEEKIIDQDITSDLSDIFATDEYKQEVFKQEEKENEEPIDLFGDFYRIKE